MAPYHNNSKHYKIKLIPKIFKHPLSTAIKQPKSIKNKNKLNQSTEENTSPHLTNQSPPTFYKQ